MAEPKGGGECNGVGTMIESFKRIFLTCAVVSCLPSLQLAAQQRPATQNRNYAELLKRFDRNGDGRLDEQERQALGEEIRQRAGQRSAQAPANRPTREQLIQRFDRNGNGRLDADELAEVRRQVQRQPNQARPQGVQRAVLERFDTNRNGRLDPPEQEAAREAFRQRTSQRPNDRPAPAGNANDANRQRFLERFDTNGNGQLDPAEQQAARQAADTFRRRSGQQGNQRSGGLSERAERKSRLDTTRLLEQFDLDGNGRLDGDERAAALEAMRNRT
jgi:Ca2+-binding EF-hand superfamily protein